MVLLIVGLVLAVALLALPVAAAVLAQKKGARVWKPLLWGAGAMAVASLLPAFYAILADALAQGGTAAAAFFGGPWAAALSWVVMGVCFAGAITLALRVLFKAKANAFEALLFGVGVCAPTLLYRGVIVALTYLGGIGAGTDYASALVVTATFTWVLLSTLTEAPLAVIAAYFVNGGKSLAGFALCAAAEIVALNASSIAETLGLYDWITTLAGALILAGAVWMAARLWPRLPAPVPEKAKIQWPDREEEGR